jgi:hypothetical protein
MKQGKLLKKGGVKLQYIAGIIVEPNILAQKGIIFYPPRYFEIANVTKFHHHRTVPAQGTLVQQYYTHNKST